MAPSKKAIHHMHLDARRVRLHVRGRGQQFQGPGFRVFGQNLIKISTNARSKQHLFAVVLPVFKMAVTAVPTASASRKGQAWHLQNGLVLDLGPTRRHRFHLPMPASGRFTPHPSPLPTSASFSDDNRSPPPPPDPTTTSQMH